ENSIQGLERQIGLLALGRAWHQRRARVLVEGVTDELVFWQRYRLISQHLGAGQQRTGNVRAIGALEAAELRHARQRNDGVISHQRLDGSCVVGTGPRGSSDSVEQLQLGAVVGLFDKR